MGVCHAFRVYDCLVLARRFREIDWIEPTTRRCCYGDVFCRNDDWTSRHGALGGLNWEDKSLDFVYNWDSIDMLLDLDICHVLWRFDSFCIAEWYFLLQGALMGRCDEWRVLDDGYPSHGRSGGVAGSRFRVITSMAFRDRSSDDV